MDFIFAWQGGDTRPTRIPKTRAAKDGEVQRFVLRGHETTCFLSSGDLVGFKFSKGKRQTEKDQHENNLLAHAVGVLSR